MKQVIRYSGSSNTDKQSILQAKEQTYIEQLNLDQILEADLEHDEVEDLNKSKKKSQIGSFNIQEQTEILYLMIAKQLGET